MCMNCVLYVSLTAIGRRSTIPRSVVLHEHHRPEPFNSVTTATSRSSKSSRIKQPNRRRFLHWPVNSSTTRSRSRTFDGFPLQSTRSSLETRQRRQLRGKMLMPKSTQTNNRQHSDTRSSSSVANDKDQRAEIVPETPNVFHPDGNIMALFPKRYALTFKFQFIDLSFFLYYAWTGYALSITSFWTSAPFLLLRLHLALYLC